MPPMAETPLPAPPPGTSQVGCAICLQLRSTRVPAVTTINGYAVCADHVGLAARPGFDIARIRGGTTRSEPL